MANSNKSGDYYEYATVDTAPGASGFWTNAVKMRKKGLGDKDKMVFSIRSTDVDASATDTVTVTLQFKCIGDQDWTDYYNDGNAFNIGERKLIEDFAGGVQWRAGVKNGDYTSGSVTFGFDW